MATSLLALLDDIATVLDDVTVMTKVAAGRTAGVLGDDLALNAEQVSGVRAERELPVVWAVFKGSARNKLILVPAALLLAAFAPFMIQPLLMLGGCYLCYEGFEKVAGRWLHPGEKEQQIAAVLAVLHNPKTDLLKFEQDKIKGAIRTDFVLSAEIIVIAMGTVQEAAFTTQVFTVIAIATLMTIGVYGLVAGIVKLDDVGLHLVDTGSEGGVKMWIGNRLLDFAPFLMKTLTVVGTAAMFLVGGGIIAHGVPPLHHLTEDLLLQVDLSWLSMVASMLVNAIVGIIAGGLLVPVVTGFGKLKTLVMPAS
jgi:predicted DNA repair protein MutK